MYKYYAKVIKLLPFLLYSQDSLSNGTSLINSVTNYISWTIFYDIVLSLVTGTIGGIIAWILIKWKDEKDLRKQFLYLEDEWIHLNIDKTKIGDAITKIKYKPGGKLDFSSQTQYGEWTGRVVMDKDMPKYGGGTYQYTSRKESGLLQIIIRNEDIIYIAPSVLTSNTQKTDIYYLKRKKQ